MLPPFKVSSNRTSEPPGAMTSSIGSSALLSNELKVGFPACAYSPCYVIPLVVDVCRARLAARAAPAQGAVTAAEPAPLPSSHPLAYWNFRDRLAGDFRQNRVRPTAELIIQHASIGYGLDAAQAAEWTERFLHRVERDLGRKSAGGAF